MTRQPRAAAGSVEKFLRLADQFESFAAEARTETVKQGLERLATRFRVFAAQNAADGQAKGASGDLYDNHLHRGT